MSSSMCYHYFIRPYQVRGGFDERMKSFAHVHFADSEESVVAKVLSSLRNLAELGLFPRMRAWELMSATLALLYHPNVWIRQSKLNFLSKAFIMVTYDCRCHRIHRFVDQTSPFLRYLGHTLPVFETPPSVGR